MSNVGQLNDRPKAALANLAKRRGIRGWESMNKVDLIKALSRDTRPSKSTKRPAPTKKVHHPRVTVKAAAKVTAKRPAKLAAKVKLPAKRGTTAKAAINVLHRATATKNGSTKSAATPPGKAPDRPRQESRPQRLPRQSRNSRLGRPARPPRTASSWR